MNQEKNLIFLTWDSNLWPLWDLIAKKLAKCNFSFFFLTQIPTISTTSAKYAFVAYITADEMYMVRSE